MVLFQLLYIALLGLVFGSFANVLITRKGFFASTVKRSHCPKCKKNIPPWHLIPVFSYIFLRGKCSNCSYRIPLRYLFVEITAAILFLASFYFIDNIIEASLFSLILLLCLVLVVCDWETKTIPDSFILIVYILSLASVFLFSDAAYQSLLYGLVLSVPFFIIWGGSLGRAMGVGDGLIALPLGFFLTGYVEVFTTFILSFWIGCLFIIFRIPIRMLKKEKIFTRKEAIPFLPFLFLSFLVIFFARLAGYPVTEIFFAGL